MSLIFRWALNLTLSIFLFGCFHTIAVGGENGRDPIFVGSDEYQKILSKGHEAFKKKEFDKAVRYYSEAQHFRFVDVPNFRSLTKLALSYYYVGKHKKAKATLEKSRIALSVVAGVMKCIEIDSHFEIWKTNGEPMKSDEGRDVASLICGGAYEGYYSGRASLTSFLNDARLIEEYFDAKKIIE